MTVSYFAFFQVNVCNFLFFADVYLNYTIKIVLFKAITDFYLVQNKCNYSDLPCDCTHKNRESRKLFYSIAERNVFYHHDIQFQTTNQFPNNLLLATNSNNASFLKQIRCQAAIHQRLYLHTMATSTSNIIWQHNIFTYKCKTYLTSCLIKITISITPNH